MWVLSLDSDKAKSIETMPNEILSLKPISDQYFGDFGSFKKMAIPQLGSSLAERVPSMRSCNSPKYRYCADK